jgi:hypothetical protein
MKNSRSKVVSGAMIGGIVGISALTIFLMCRKKETALDEIGKVISNVSEILESHHVKEAAPVKEFGKTLHHHESTLCAAVDWIATGICLWKKFKN